MHLQRGMCKDECLVPLAYYMKKQKANRRRKNKGRKQLMFKLIKYARTLPDLACRFVICNLCYESAVWWSRTSGL
jgi:hypothetical protein